MPNYENAFPNLVPPTKKLRFRFSFSRDRNLQILKSRKNKGSWIELHGFNTNPGDWLLWTTIRKVEKIRGHNNRIRYIYIRPNSLKSVMAVKIKSLPIASTAADRLILRCSPESVAAFRKFLRDWQFHRLWSVWKKVDRAIQNHKTPPLWTFSNDCPRIPGASAIYPIHLFYLTQCEAIAFCCTA